MRKSSLALLLTLVTAAVFAKDRPYESLLVIQEDISIANVEAAIVSVQSHHQTAVELKIKGRSACGDKMLATQVDNVLRFYQVGEPGPHIQPGCQENIQYFWTPGDWDTADGQPSIVKLSILDEALGVKSGFEVSVLVVKKRGQLPNGNGVGIYFEYSQLKITKI